MNGVLERLEQIRVEVEELNEKVDRLTGADKPVKRDRFADKRSPMVEDWPWVDSQLTRHGVVATEVDLTNRGYHHGRMAARQRTPRPKDYQRHHPAWRRGFDLGWKKELNRLR